MTKTADRDVPDALYDRALDLCTALNIDFATAIVLAKSLVAATTDPVYRARALDDDEQLLRALLRVAALELIASYRWSDEVFELMKITRNEIAAVRQQIAETHKHLLAIGRKAFFAAGELKPRDDDETKH